jgi:hypothetical protein
MRKEFSMKNRFMLGITVVCLSAAIYGVTASAQGPGYGRGRGMGNGMGMSGGMGMGRGMGIGGGACLLGTLTPQTPAQQALMTKVNDLRTRIFSTRQQLLTLQTQNAPQSQITAKQNELISLQTQMQSLVRSNPGQFTAMGVGAGMMGGGWWTMVTPKTAQQKALVAKVTDLHNQIRTANLDLYALQTAGAPADKIAAKKQQVLNLQTELQKVSQANSALLQQMGLAPGAGICNGTGPGSQYGAGTGMGMGRGRGRGMGMGMGWGNGTGPNPNCPLR